MRLFKYFIIIIILYILIPYILIFFPKKGVESLKKDRKIYLSYDPLHVNLILDVRDNRLEWIRFFPKLLSKGNFNYLEFGFGDKETYLNTPNWEDLKLITALKALFLNTDSAIHLSYYQNIDSSKVKTLYLTKTQYRKLVDSILKSFGTKPEFISKGYGSRDAFYRAIYKYNLFFTCNTWVDEVLKEANISVTIWTPFSYPLIRSLR